MCPQDWKERKQELEGEDEQWIRLVMAEALDPRVKNALTGDELSRAVDLLLPNAVRVRVVEVI